MVRALIGLDSIPAPAADVVGRLVTNQPDGRLEAVSQQKQLRVKAETARQIQADPEVLNEFGASIWSLADGSRTVADIVAEVCLAYAVDSDTAQRDTLEFLQNLLERGIIQIVDHRLR